MRAETRSEAVEEWVLLVFLVVCFLLSFLKDVFPFLEKGLTAALFAAVFFVLKQIRDIRLEIRHRGDFVEKFYPTADEFYSSAARAVGRAERQVCATYFRDVPPSPDRDSRQQYFAAVLDFARKKGTVRRLIKVTNPKLAEWCLEQQRLSKEIPCYYVAVQQTLGDVEPMNMAILDEETLYLAFAGPTDSQLGGVRPAGNKQAEFFQSRFEEHWRRATPIDEFVAGERFQELLRQRVHGDNPVSPA